MRLPFDYDPGSRIKRTLHVDNVDPRRIAMETTQDTKPYYEANQTIRNMGSKLELPDWGRAVADIPISDYMELCKEYPDLKAKGPGAREARQKAIRTILSTHPKRFCWLWQDGNFYGKKRRT